MLTLLCPIAAAAKSLQSCPTLRPQGRQPTRLPYPWDSPGKNTGVGCHFLLQCMKVKSESEDAQSCLTLRDPMEPTRILRPWDCPGKSTGVGCHCLLWLCPTLVKILSEVPTALLFMICPHNSQYHSLPFLSSSSPQPSPQAIDQQFLDNPFLPECSQFCLLYLWCFS